MPDNDGFPTADEIAHPKPKADALYGYCPECYKPGKSRERRPDGDDTCVDGHVYKSSMALVRKSLVPPTAVPPVTPRWPVIPPAVELTQEQAKAISLIVSGHTFVMLALRPTKEQPDGTFAPCAVADATGCDFLSCLHGHTDTLMAAKDTLPSVIDRLYAKRGLL